MAAILPATSVHLNYNLPLHQDVESVNAMVLHNEVNVLNSYNSTYFCALNFSPGGYCGIQQRDSPQDKIAIFSVWNGDEKVKSIHSNSAATVQPFGGEGEGMKCTMPLLWDIGETLAFTVIVDKVQHMTFHIRCYLQFRSEEIYMCTYEYKGKFPGQTMASFIEDWNRYPGANGMYQRRAAHFYNSHCTINDTKHELKRVYFTKVEDDHDRHGRDRCGASVVGHKFHLFTGGDVVSHGSTSNNTWFSI